MTLYEINQQILDAIDMETGEIIDDAKFDDLQMERTEKLENIALYYKNLLSEAEALKAEKNAFAEREKQAKTKADSLKKLLDKELNGSKFETVRVKVSYRKSSALEYDGESDVPDEYLKYADPVLDKTSITKDIKSGKHIDGFSIVERNNIQVK